MPVKPWTCLVLALTLAGCMSNPSDPTTPGDLQHFQENFELRIPDEALKPQGVPNVDGLVFEIDDCVFFSPESEEETWQLTNGTFVLEWDDSDGSEMNISLGAHDLDSWIYGPMGPSPRVLDFPSVNATWEFPVLVIVHGDLAVGEIMKDATAQIRFSYIGDEPWVFRSNC